MVKKIRVKKKRTQAQTPAPKKDQIRFKEESKRVCKWCKRWHWNLWQGSQDTWDIQRWTQWQVQCKIKTGWSWHIESSVQTWCGCILCKPQTTSHFTYSMGIGTCQSILEIGWNGWTQEVIHNRLGLVTKRPSTKDWIRNQKWIARNTWQVCTHWLCSTQGSARRCQTWPWSSSN